MTDFLNLIFIFFELAWRVKFIKYFDFSWWTWRQLRRSTLIRRMRAQLLLTTTLTNSMCFKRLTRLMARRQPIWMWFIYERLILIVWIFLYFFYKIILSYTAHTFKRIFRKLPMPTSELRRRFKTAGLSWRKARTRRSAIIVRWIRWWTPFETICWRWRMGASMRYRRTRWPSWRRGSWFRRGSRVECRVLNFQRHFVL